MTDRELLQAIGQVVEAKIEPLRQDIRELQGGVQRLEVRMEHLETRMDALESRMDRLEERVDVLEEKVRDIRVYMDTEQKRTLDLLLEGQKAVWDRAVPPEKYEDLDIRTSALEMAVRQHSRDILELKLA